MLFMLFTACKNHIQKDLTKESIIPEPVSVKATNSSFELTKKTVIYIEKDNAEIKQIAEYFSGIVNKSTGFNIKVKLFNKKFKSGNLYFSVSDSILKKHGKEAYKLKITEDFVLLSANSPEGLFRGIQTLRQILPAKIESNTVQKGPWLIATGIIIDYPEYAYRGAMLDVARHFFPVKDIKRFTDLLAYYKINVLHLHLSDDQGWRIEIKSYPKLTSVGGKTQVGGGKAGFYTQKDYKNIIKYAQKRYITIIPEIDMPGHINAALASYPELNCNGKAPELYTGTDVGFSSLCVKKETTYQFIDSVIGELAKLTPGNYIHIGGDESHATKPKEYIKFINSVKHIVESHNKIMIGWDETANAAIDDKNIIQFWANKKNTLKGVRKGARVIMSPAKKIYLDMQYDSTTVFGLHWAGYIDVDTAYLWNPAAYIKGVSKKDILGIEAPLWTETVTKMKDIEYMVFPRLPGIAEIGWSSPEVRNWDDYKKRLGKHAEHFKYLNINYYKSKLIPWNLNKNEKTF